MTVDLVFVRTEPPMHRIFCQQKLVVGRRRP